MGTISNRRKNRTGKRLAGLAKSNPEKFHTAWHARMTDLLREVSRRSPKSGSMVDNEGRTLSPVFDVVADARRILNEAGINEAALEEHNSISMLNNACTSAVASQHGRDLYHINIIVEPRE